MTRRSRQVTPALTPSGPAIFRYVRQLEEFRLEQTWQQAAGVLKLMQARLPETVSSKLGRELCYTAQLSDVPTLRGSARKLLEMAADRATPDDAARLLNQAAQLAASQGDQARALGNYQLAYERAVRARTRPLQWTIAINRADYALARGQLVEAIDLLPNDPDLPPELLVTATIVRQRATMLLGRDDDGVLHSLVEGAQAAANVAGRDRSLEIAASICHLGIQNAIRLDDAPGALTLLRRLEVVVSLYAAGSDYLDARTATISSLWAIAQLEYAAHFGETSDQERAGRYAGMIRVRAIASLGKSSPSATSLEIGAAVVRAMAARPNQGRIRVGMELIAELPNVAREYRALTSYSADRITKNASQLEVTSSRAAATGSGKAQKADASRETKAQAPTRSTEWIADLVEEFGLHSEDSGSPEVQAAILSKRIKALTIHLRDHPQDHHSRRGLLILVGRRRRLLNYLKSVSIDRYRALLERLDLRR